MDASSELDRFIDARSPLIALDTIEEERAVALVGGIAARRQLPLFTWKATVGLRRLPAAAAAKELAPPVELLRQLTAHPEDGVVLLLDLHPYLTDPVLARSLRDAAAAGGRRTLILVGHAMTLPPAIDKLAMRLELPPPGRDEYLEILKDEVMALRRERPQAEPLGEAEAVAALLDQLAGLTALDARQVIRRVLRDDGAITRADLAQAFSAKHRLLGQDGALALENTSVRLEDLAGLARFKAWLATRSGAFRGEAAAAGLDPPKGILLLGVQGCGKSMAVKAVAAAWAIPLLRLDFGALYNKFLGETERNLRESLRVADAMAPCVLWLDELEKGLATSLADGGESRRLLGTLLTWMAERRSRVFLVATSNDIEALPPELVRKGRFDEIFFVDLPAGDVRREILRIHLARRGQDPGRFDLEQLAAGTEGFSGAELEQAVVGALYAANAAGTPLDTGQVAAEAARTRPLAVVMAEKIAYLRAWAAGRTVPAD